MGLPTNDYLRIVSKSYGPRKPLVVCEASSLDMLADIDCAEGSTATVGGTEYVLDRVNGWVEPGSGGGGGGSGVLVVTATYDEQTEYTTLDKTWQEIHDAALVGAVQGIYIDGDKILVMQLVKIEITAQSRYLASFSYPDFSSGSGAAYAVDSYSASSANNYPAM